MDKFSSFPPQALHLSSERVDSHSARSPNSPRLTRRLLDSGLRLRSSPRHGASTRWALRDADVLELADPALQPKTGASQHVRRGARHACETPSLFCEHALAVARRARE